MSKADDLAFVRAVLLKLNTLQNAVQEYGRVLRTEGDPQRHIPEEIYSATLAVTKAAGGLTGEATDRLDKLARQYLHTEPGEWAGKLLDDIGRGCWTLELWKPYRITLNRREKELRNLSTLIRNEVETPTPSAKPQGTPISKIRSIATRPELLDFCKRLRNDLASGEESRRIGWAVELWGVLRELWAAMGRIGEAIPPRPAILNHEGFIPVLRGLPESFYQDALRAVDEIVQWADSGNGAAATPPSPATVPPAMPAGATTGDGEPLTGAERDAAFQSLQPAAQRAYLSFQCAQTKQGGCLEDREAHELLVNDGIPTDQGNLGLLVDYEPPDFATWARQLREARKALAEQKYKRRGRAPKTRSIVTGKQIENQKGDGE